jgi:predicted nuclease of restriction endonuclease-like (RecB) superfamily
LPWFHIVTLLTKLSEPLAREWYAALISAHGWSRSTLEAHIRGQLLLRQGAAITNFVRHLAPPDGKLAIESLKDRLLAPFATTLAAALR